MHDPKAYPNPEVFEPERFLQDGRINKGVRDPSEVAFGFGRRCVFTLRVVYLILRVNEIVARRICPGRHFANDGLFLTFVSILSVYNIRPAVDDAGSLLPVTADTPDAGSLL